MSLCNAPDHTYILPLHLASRTPTLHSTIVSVQEGSRTCSSLFLKLQAFPCKTRNARNIKTDGYIQPSGVADVAARLTGISPYGGSTSSDIEALQVTIPIFVSAWALSFLLFLDLYSYLSNSLMPLRDVEDRASSTTFRQFMHHQER